MFVDPLYSRILLHAFGLILAACVPTAGRADDWPMLAHTVPVRAPRRRRFGLLSSGSGIASFRMRA